MHRFVLAGVLLLIFTASVVAQEPAKVTTLMSLDLTDLPGKEGTMLIVEYPPGGVDPVHRHDAHGFIYVLEGVFDLQLGGGWGRYGWRDVRRRRRNRGIDVRSVERGGVRHEAAGRATMSARLGLGFFSRSAAAETRMPDRQ